MNLIIKNENKINDLLISSFYHYLNLLTITANEKDLDERVEEAGKND